MVPSAAEFTHSAAVLVAPYNVKLHKVSQASGEQQTISGATRMQRVLKKHEQEVYLIV